MESGDTCWTVLTLAASGDRQARDSFAQRYLPVVRGYLAARWRGGKRSEEIDDATQQVFLECLRENGALERAMTRAGRGFGAFLFGVTCNVARRVESGRGAARSAVSLDDESEWQIASGDDPASAIFQRGWAGALVAEAGTLHRNRAQQLGQREQQRVALLEMKFSEDVPVREIAKRLGMDATFVHREYSRARKEFRGCLEEVIAFHYPGSAANVEGELVQLLSQLS